MPLINVSVSMAHGSRIKVDWSSTNPDILAVALDTNLCSDYEGAMPFVYDRTIIHLCGMPADLRLLAEEIVKALKPLNEIHWDVLELANQGA